jgi:hypothetical protein
VAEAKDDKAKSADAKDEKEKSADAKGEKGKSEDPKDEKGKGGDEKDKKEPARGTGPTATRQQKKREERMKLIEEQIADGTLTIRQMTPEERKANPPRPPKKKRGR